jgi:hypothetical protein
MRRNQHGYWLRGLLSPSAKRSKSGPSRDVWPAFGPRACTELLALDRLKCDFRRAEPLTSGLQSRATAMTSGDDRARLVATMRV